MRRRVIGFALVLAIVLAAVLALLLARHEKQGSTAGVVEFDAPQVYVQQGHHATVISIAWSPDGRYAISGGRDGLVKIWKVATGREVYSLRAHATGWVTAVAYVAHGKQFLTAGTDSTVRIWDASTLTESRRFNTAAPVNSVSLSANGDRILCTTSDSVAYIWNTNSGPELQRVTTGFGGAICSAFSGDGRYAITGGSQDTTLLTKWEVNAGRAVQKFRLAPGALLCVAFDESGAKIFSGNGNLKAFVKSRAGVGLPGPRADYAEAGKLEIWDVQSGGRTQYIVAHDYGVSAIQILPDGRRVLSCGLDGTMKLWGIEDGQLLTQYPVQDYPVTAASLSPDGYYILTGGSDGAIHLWDIERGSLVRDFARLAGAVSEVAFSPDGTRIRTALWDRLMSWDARTGRRVEVVFPSEQGEGWNWTRDCRHALARIAGDDAGSAYIKFWSVERGPLGITSQPVLGDVKAWAVDSNGHFALTETVDSVYTRWDIATGQKAGSFTGDCPPLCVKSQLCRTVSLSANGQRAMAKRCVPEVDYFDFTTNRHMILRDTAMDVRFDPDGWGGGCTTEALLSSSGDRAVISRFDGTVEFWDVLTGRITRSLKLDDAAVRLVQSSDERWFAGQAYHLAAIDWWTGTEYLRTRIWDCSSVGMWDAQTGRKVREFFDQTGYIVCNGLSADDHRLVTSSYGGITRVWSVVTGKEIVQLVSFLNGEWIAVTPEGYYTASLNGDASLNVRAGSMVTGIEPYRSTFYQPAVVEAALRLGDSEAAIREVLGCKETCTTIADLPTLEPPIVEIKYPRNGDTLRTTDATLVFRVEDRHSSIKSVRVFVNGRPLTRRTTAATSDATSRRFIDIAQGNASRDLKVPVQLDEGDNQISIIVLGRSEAVVNLQVRVQSTETGSEPWDIDTIWILAVGVNRYDDRRVRRLSYCQNDAQGVIQAFESQAGKTCRKVMSVCLTDDSPEKPTYAAIVSNIGFLQRAGERDLAVLFMAGHGENDSTGDFYFLPSDAEIAGPHDFNKSKAISSASLLEAVNVSARRLVFLDACHSGDVGVDVVRLARGLKDNRVLVMTSSEGSRPSIESDSLQHGVFTYALIEGLEGEGNPSGVEHKVTALQLITYVSSRVIQLTGQKQNPVFWAPAGLENLVVAAPLLRSAFP
ncbi:caspase family protein [candidate division KSB1 bacterium]|nr:caspase family protein [candidate division KSB1 bacterium]